MDWVETTGRSIEEATKAALEQLGVDEADADVEVIADAKWGLFGRLREEARVRARVQPRYPRAKADRRDRRRSNKAAGATETSGEEAQTPSGPPKAVTATAKTPTATTAVPNAASTAGSGQVDTLASGPSRSRTRASTEPRTSPAARQRRSRRPVGDEGEAMETGGSSTLNEVTSETLEAQATMAEDFLRGLLTEMGATATITSALIADGLVQVDLEGKDLGTLIGPKGSTLSALQELTRTVLQRQSTADGRVVLDINGYRRKRHEALALFTQQVAQDVLAKGARRALEPMPSPDRKVVHDTVNDIDGVRSISEGEEPYRRVVLVPASEADTSSGEGS